MTPNDLDVLLHYYTTVDAPHERLQAPAVVDTISRFLAYGIFEEANKYFTPGSGLYKVTAKGKAWVQMILGTPYPEFRWVDPRRGRATP